MARIEHIDNNGVTGLHNSYPRVIAALKVLLELVYFKYLPLLYGTIGGSLNISLSNNPVFLGHFTRVEPSEVIGLCGFRCYPRVICRF